MAEAYENYILEPTYDGKGWVAADVSCDMIISWDNMNFMNTIKVMFASAPEDEIEKEKHLKEMEVLVKWLSKYHFEKLYDEL